MPFLQFLLNVGSEKLHLRHVENFKIEAIRLFVTLDLYGSIDTLQLMHGFSLFWANFKHVCFPVKPSLPSIF